jgi:acid phosphatase
MKAKSFPRFVSLLISLSFLLTLLACRGVVMQARPPDPIALKSPEQVGAHVFLVVFENQRFDVIVGRPPAPYINNSLIPQGGLATQFFADTHPSIGNYFMLTCGQIISNDLFFGEIVDVDNLARLLGQNGVSWKAYMEDLPSVGYTGDRAYPYVKSHNPFAFYSDIHFVQQQANNMVPFSQFASDLANHTLPSFSYIVPNQINNMHDCPPPGGPTCTNEDKITLGDTWLKNNIGPLLASPEFQKDGILIITWDESFDTDNTNGGGHIPVIILGPGVKAGFQSTTMYKHESVLRLIEEKLTVPVTLGNSTAAPSMDEFLVGH